jgi:hypothetical protein
MEKSKTSKLRSSEDRYAIRKVSYRYNCMGMCYAWTTTGFLREHKQLVCKMNNTGETK